MAAEVALSASVCEQVNVDGINECFFCCKLIRLGQVQSVDGARVTVNFENAGKHLINADVIALRVVRDSELDG